MPTRGRLAHGPRRTEVEEDVAKGVALTVRLHNDRLERLVVDPEILALHLLYGRHHELILDLLRQVDGQAERVLEAGEGSL